MVFKKRKLVDVSPASDGGDVVGDSGADYDYGMKT